MDCVVLDTGPLVAYFDVRDRDHPVVSKWFAKHSAKHALATTEAVITEVTHLLDFNLALQTAFLRWVSAAVEVTPVSPADYPTIAQWIDNYANVPMDFADATVLWLVGKKRGAQILTLDARGFGVFRMADTAHINTARAGKLPSVIALD
jgi:uncharacterized protein